ncbi:hypothetical protein EZS27_039852, partial [termite gut metagenome]
MWAKMRAIWENGSLSGDLGIYLFSKKSTETYRVSARTMNVALLSIMMVIVGYSSYALIV